MTQLMGREMTPQERQAAAAALEAANRGDMKTARLMNKLLELTIEDNNAETGETLDLE